MAIELYPEYSMECSILNVGDIIYYIDCNNISRKETFIDTKGIKWFRYKDNPIIIPYLIVGIRRIHKECMEGKTFPIDEDLDQETYYLENLDNKDRYDIFNESEMEDCYLTLEEAKEIFEKLIS